MGRKATKKIKRKYNITKAYVQYMGLDGIYTKDNLDPKVWPGVLLVNWVCENFGYGQLTFYEKKGRLHCDTECMDKEFVKAVMDKLLKGAKYLD